MISGTQQFIRRSALNCAALVAIVSFGPSEARADALCVKNRINASVRSGRVRLTLPRHFQVAASTCPTGYTKIATTGEPISGTLSAGETLSGFWNLGSDGTLLTAPGTISFPKPLAVAPSVEIVRLGAVGTNCTGTVAAPTASAGYLCIYEGYSVNVAAGSSGITTFNLDGSGGPNQASTQGAALYGNRDTASEYFAWGSWAVKAP